jgi:hypothetical protein
MISFHRFSIVEIQSAIGGKSCLLSTRELIPCRTLHWSAAGLRRSHQSHGARPFWYPDLRMEGRRSGHRREDPSARHGDRYFRGCPLPAPKNRKPCCIFLGVGWRGILGHGSMEERPTQAACVATHHSPWIDQAGWDASRAEQRGASVLRDRVELVGARLIPLALVLTAGTAFGGVRVDCPLVLEEGAIAVVRPPPGWLGTSHERMRLTNGGVMRGHPDGSAYLKPARMTKFKGGGTSSNEFAAGEERSLWQRGGRRFRYRNGWTTRRQNAQRRTGNRSEMALRHCMPSALPHPLRRHCHAQLVSHDLHGMGDCRRARGIGAGADIRTRT